MLDNGATTLWESWKLETEVSALPQRRMGCSPTLLLWWLGVGVCHATLACLASRQAASLQVYSQNHVMNGAGVELLWRRCFATAFVLSFASLGLVRHRLLSKTLQPLRRSRERDVMQWRVTHHPAACTSAARLGRLQPHGSEGHDFFLVRHAVALRVTCIDHRRRYNSSASVFNWRIAVPVDTSATVMIPLAGECCVLWRVLQNLSSVRVRSIALLLSSHDDCCGCLADGDVESDVCEGEPPRPLAEVNDVQVME
jgi:hypothetical protein